MSRHFDRFNAGQPCGITYGTTLEKKQIIRS